MLDPVQSTWRVINLGDAITLSRGKDLPVQDRSQGHYPVIGSNGIVGYHASFVAKSPGVLVGRSGSVGEVAWVEQDYWPLNTTLWVTDFHGNDPRFISFFLRYLDLGRFTGGVSVPTLNRNVLHRIEVRIPPVVEQQAISSSLQAVQEAGEARKRELAFERERKAAMMEHFFTYGVQGTTRLVEARSHGRVPTDWTVLPLEECAFIQTGVAKGRKLGDKETISVPYLRVANVQDGYLNLSEMKTIQIRQSELKRYELQQGDIVLTEGGDFDKLGRGFVWTGGVTPCIHQNHVFAVRPNRRLLMPEFLAYLVQSPYGRSYFLSVAHKTTNLACINKTKLGRFPTLLPHLDEQVNIVKALRASDAKILALEHESHYLRELFNGLLEHLMSGQLDATRLISVEAHT